MGFVRSGLRGKRDRGKETGLTEVQSVGCAATPGPRSSFSSNWGEYQGVSGKGLEWIEQGIRLRTGFLSKVSDHSLPVFKTGITKSN